MTDRPSPLPERLYEVNAAAARFYTSRLPGSRKAAQYLGSHGIDTAAEPSAPWGVGYAPARWTTLSDHLRGAGFTAEEIKAAGLGFTHRVSGHLLDRFRDRLMFPITDPDNRVVGFTARDLSGRAEAKWLNSTENAVYRKGLVLYGLGQQLAYPPTGVGEPVVFVVEGAADVLAMHRLAATHAIIPETSPVYAVAPCGTNLTREQLTVLHQRLPGAHLVVAFDGDDAGSRAVARTYPVATKWPGQVSGVRLPKGQDPADLVAAMDPLWAMDKIFGEIVPLAQIVMTHRIDNLFKTGRITKPSEYVADRLAAYRAIAELFIDAPQASTAMAHAAAAQLGVDPTDVIRGVIEAWEARTEAASGSDPPPGSPPPQPPPRSCIEAPTPSTPTANSPTANREPVGRSDARPTISASARLTSGPAADRAAVATRHDPATGTTVWALANAIGNHPQAATAAALAAEIAATVALRSAPAAAMRAARSAINAFYDGVQASQAGDASLIVVSAYRDSRARHGVRFELAWAGDCRAYTIRGGNLDQVTADHTQTRHRRDGGQTTPGSVAEILLTSSVRAGDISVCPLDAGPLLVCNNELYRAIPETRLAAELAEMSDAQTTANRLVTTAGHRTPGNPAVLLIHARTARPAWVTTTPTPPRPRVTATASPATVAKTSFVDAPTAGNASPTTSVPPTTAGPTGQARQSIRHHY